jgi:hypothetical protein
VGNEQNCRTTPSLTRVLMSALDSDDLNVGTDESVGQAKATRKDGGRRLFTIGWAVTTIIASAAWLYLIARAAWIVASWFFT